ncbi:hypothetical protein TSAR_001181 [Trichomalopsis sarcophagae]|uniref:Odorant receptor n=1 Tax=Trichomalopsis sarcophagae TaxID=543379 RepID=A0A232FNB8_9HYME|nr:hypothetical protein TSAR_001181 [Trichomalopsis sarcophagae]
MQIKVVENLPLTKHDIEYFFKDNLKLLSKIGFECSLTKKSEKFKFYHRIPTYIANFCGLIFFALQIYFVIDKIQTNTVLAIQSFSYALINIQSILKGFITANSIEIIQQIFENLGIFWQKYMSRKPGRELILDRAYKIISLCKFFFAMAITCCFVFVMQFLIKFSIQYLNREATNHTYDFSNTVALLKYPFEIPNLPVYFLLISGEIIYLFVCVVFWCNPDSLFVTLTSHVYVQFKALKIDMTSAFNNSTLKERSILIDMVNRHRELLRMCYLIEDTYSPIIFSTTLLSAVNMCVTIYATREYIDKGYYLEMGIPLFLFIGASFQILFYCVFAETLTDEMIIMRCQKPFYCTAYGFFPIGHPQLTSIISTAFSYYMMLKTMTVKKLRSIKHDIAYFKENLILLSFVDFKCSITKKGEKFKLHHKYQLDIEKIVEYISSLILIPSGSNGEELLDKAYKTLLMCRIYLFTSFVTYLALTARLFINFCFPYLNREATNDTYDFSKRMILMKYPFEIQSVSIYILVTFIEGHFLLITATFWTSGDCLFATVTTQICIQFDKYGGHYLKHVIPQIIYEVDEKLIHVRAAVHITVHNVHLL